jgi:hypothetical protein
MDDALFRQSGGSSFCLFLFLLKKRRRMSNKVPFVVSASV